MAHRKKSKKIRTGKILTGTVQKNPRGFAFIIPDLPTQPDVYVGTEEAQALLSKDRVAFSIAQKKGKRHAKIHEVLQRGQTQYVGCLERYQGDYWLNTDDGAFLVAPTEKKVRAGDWTVCKILHYPSATSAGEVEIVENMGTRPQPKDDIRFALARYNLSDAFPPAVEKEARACVYWMKDPRVKENRKDLRNVPLVTIDGEDAKDFDDAVAVLCPNKGPAFILYVCIADVSFFVRPGTSIDREAQLRGTSVYFPGQCLPMLPESLSSNLCSLLPKTERLAVTAEIHFDRDGNVIDRSFYSSLICTVERLTYEKVHRFLQRDPPTLKQYAHIKSSLRTMRALYQRLAKQRKQRGTIDFELPESHIEVDEHGTPVQIHPAERYESHRWVEEFMIAANREVAKALREGDEKALYRTHLAPDASALDEVNQALRMLGFNHRIKTLTPESFSQLLHSTQKHPNKKTLHSFLLRQQKQARYDTEPRGHFGLALKDYAHFTSPIRRYPDLVVHRALKQLISSTNNADKSIEEAMSLPELAQHTSQRERLAVEAERYVTRRKQCWLLARHEGKEFDGTIGWVDPNGLYIDIAPFGVEGFLALEDLRTYYEYSERQMCLIERPGKRTLKTGDSIRVRILEVCVDRGKIWLGAGES